MPGTNKTYKRTTIISVLLASVLLGLVAAKVTHVQISIWWLVVAVIVFAAVARQKRAASIVAVIILGLTVGIIRGNDYIKQLAPYSQLVGQKVIVQVTADSSAGYSKTKQLEFDGARVTILAPIYKELPGKMVISGYGENSILRGDVLTVEGKLYARRGGKQAGISYGKLDVIKRSSSVLEKLRRDFLAGLSTALPEPDDQFAAGLLVGQKSDLPEDVTQTLRIVGLSHIIAVSGYNLTILADVARRRLGKKSKFRSTVIAILLVIIFVILAGSSASIARSAFVSILSIVASYYGRTLKPVLLILLAATFTAYLNPINIWSDIGWYLSFLAFFGVLVVAPSIMKRFFSAKKPIAPTQLLVETMSAQLMTLPIILFIFGNVSLVALVANILVVPFVPLAMLLSLIAGVAGMLTPVLAGFFAWPARILLDFMLGVAELISRFPYATVERKITALQLAVMYIAVVIVVVVMKKKSPKSATLTE